MKRTPGSVLHLLFFNGEGSGMKIGKMLWQQRQSCVPCRDHSGLALRSPLLSSLSTWWILLTIPEEPSRLQLLEKVPMALEGQIWPHIMMANLSVNVFVVL